MSEMSDHLIFPTNISLERCYWSRTSAQTYADEIKHWMLRGALVDILLTDPRLERRWQALEAAYGIHALDDALHTLTQPEPNPLSLRILEQIKQFVVDELQRPWRWLVHDLWKGWGTRISNAVLGSQYRLLPIVDRGDPPAPTLDHPGFTTGPAEPTSKALQRLGDWLRLAQQARRRLKDHEETAAPAGKMPRDLHRTQETLGRYAEWFYRHHWRGESIRHIAKQYGTTRPPRKRKGDQQTESDFRQTIKDGIAQAEFLLSLACTSPD